MGVGVREVVLKPRRREFKGREKYTILKKQLLDRRKASEEVAGFWQCVVSNNISEISLSGMPAPEVIVKG